MKHKRLSAADMQAKRVKFFAARDWRNGAPGLSVAKAAKHAGVSYQPGYRWAKQPRKLISDAASPVRWAVDETLRLAEAGCAQEAASAPPASFLSRLEAKVREWVRSEMASILEA